MQWYRKVPVSLTGKGTGIDIETIKPGLFGANAGICFHRYNHHQSLTEPSIAFSIRLHLYNTPAQMDFIHTHVCCLYRFS